MVELREAGYDDEVVVFAEEPEVPYERPPLSKGYLQGEKSRESTYVQPRGVVRRAQRRPPTG